MGVAVEALRPKQTTTKSSSLRRPLELLSRGDRLFVEPDGSVRYLESTSERRLVFGREQVWFYKIQAGVTVQSQKVDWDLRPEPSLVSMTGRLFEGVEVSQSIEFLPPPGEGYIRRIQFRNVGHQAIRVRAIAAWDPTSAQFRDVSLPWGSIGVNAFNRGSHIAMDELSEPASARVVGANPQPDKFFMTNDKSVMVNTIQVGSVPDNVAGLTGQALILSQHEFDLQPSASTSVGYACVYHPLKLEVALEEFSKVWAGGRQNKAPPKFVCSNPTLSKTFRWASAALEGTEFIADNLDMAETLKGAYLSDPPLTKKAISSLQSRVVKEGWLPHSVDGTSPGILETSVYLAYAVQCALAEGKKAARELYPSAKRSASWLLSVSEGGIVISSDKLPQGWRRRIGKGFPAGEIPEVSMALAEALLRCSDLARYLSKGPEASRFRGRADLVVNRVESRLTDERGSLACFLDSKGTLQTQDNADLAIAAYRLSKSGGLHYAAHRLLEKDFDTGFGPRTVPTSDRIRFNSVYGEGQLGGYWTRVALALSTLCYRSGMAGTGGTCAEKVAKLVLEDSTRLGGSPGSFPLWVDVEGKVTHGPSDRVSAARFVEAILEGEVGVALSLEGVNVSPPSDSFLRWSAVSLKVGPGVTVFAGRSSGRLTLFSKGAKETSKSAISFQGSEFVETDNPEVTAISFFDPGQVVCVGNSSLTPSRGTLKFAPRAGDLSKKLGTSLEEYDQSKGTWSRRESLRVGPSMSFDVGLAPGEWKAFKVSSL